MRIYLDKSILHLEHYQNQETPRGQYLKGLMLGCFESPGDDRWAHYAGRELLWTGRPKSSIKLFEEHIQMKRWYAESAQSANFLGLAHAQLGDYEKAVESWHRAIAIDASRREPFIHLANHYVRFGDWNRVMLYSNAALQLSFSDYYANNMSHYKAEPEALLYESLVHLNRKDEALVHWKKALEFQPENPKYVSDAQFFPEILPKISVLLPTLGRAEGLQRIKDSIDSQVYPKDKIEVLVDDREEPTVPEKVQSMVSKATGEWFMYVANDLELDPFCVMQAVLDNTKTGKRLIALNDSEVLPDEGNICAHFLMHRSLYHDIGEIFSTKMVHCGVDNLLWAKAKKLDTAMRSERAKATHHHFSKDSTYDHIYARGWANADKDREILKEELAKL